MSFESWVVDEERPNWSCKSSVTRYRRPKEQHGKTGMDSRGGVIAEIETIEDDGGT